MQRGFIFLLIVWNSSTFASGNTTDRRQISLGCQAVIPCQNYRSGSNSLKWFYKKDEHSDTIHIYFQDKTGVEHHQHLSRSRMKVLRNGSLVIDHFTEDDQGLYWCKFCFQHNCWTEEPTLISVKKDILKETRKKLYAIAGSSFTHACPSKWTNLKWTFEASNMTAHRNSVQRPESDFVTSNKSIHIINVKREDAGKYTLWTSGCYGQRQKLLTINLCVITVHNSEDSSVSCALTCDTEFINIKPKDTLNVETGTRTISVSVDPYGSLNCSAEQMFDGYSTIHSTHEPSHALNKTTGIPTKAEYLTPVVYGTSAALTCLILMAILICYLRQRLRAAFPVYLCCSGLNSRVEETSVVYSSIVIRKPANTESNHMSYSDNSCVYSELKL